MKKISLSVPLLGLALLSPGASTAFSDEAVLKNAQTLTFKGEALSQTIELRDLVQKPIYENREVDSTCYREVFDGYETVCHDESYQDCSSFFGEGALEVSAMSCRDESSEVCGPGPGGHSCRPITRRGWDGGGGGGGGWGDGPSCVTRYRQACEQKATYRSEAYSCIKIVPVLVGHELIETVNATVEVEVREPAGGLPQGVALEDSLTIRIEGRSFLPAINAREMGPGQGVLLYEVIEKAVEVQEVAPKEVSLHARVVLRPVALESVKKALQTNVRDLKLSQAGVEFGTTMPLAQALVARIELRRDRMIIWDKRLFRGNLARARLDIESSADGTFHSVKVGLPELKVPALNVKKLHEVRVALGLDLSKAADIVLNGSDLPDEKDKDFKAEKTLQTRWRGRIQ